MAWVENNHSDHPVSAMCYVQGRQPPDQAAQSHIQSGLECLQKWGIHNLLGQKGIYFYLFIIGIFISDWIGRSLEFAWEF